MRKVRDRKKLIYYIDAFHYLNDYGLIPSWSLLKNTIIDKLVKNSKFDKIIMNLKIRGKFLQITQKLANILIEDVKIEYMSRKK
jgi:hypothetical protein